MKKIMILVLYFCTSNILHASTALVTRPNPIARLISITRNVINEEEGISEHPEALMAFIARVSNPENQSNPNFAGLMKYCIKNKHWSVFEHAFMTIRVRTSLAIATQILRHRSFTFQQFSQRYADPSVLAQEIPLPNLRRQDHKNRQNSIDDITPEQQAELHAKIANLNKQTINLYQELLKAGVAKECARAILPQATTTDIFITGNARSWIHYLEQRTSVETQKEHRDVAVACQQIFMKEFPTISQALGWQPEKPRE